MDPDRIPSATEPAYDRDGLHSGIGGLAHVLEEVRLARPWTAEEARLADAVAGRLRSRIPVTTDCTLFDGLAGTAGALLALGADGTDEVLERLASTRRRRRLAADHPGPTPLPARGPHPRRHARYGGRAAGRAVGEPARGVRGGPGRRPRGRRAPRRGRAPPDRHRLALGAGAIRHRARRPADAELVARPGRDRRRRRRGRRGAGPTRPGRRRGERRRAPGDARGHQRAGLRGADDRAGQARPGPGDVHLVPRPHRHVAAVRGSRPRRRGGRGG